MRVPVSVPGANRWRCGWPRSLLAFVLDRRTGAGNRLKPSCAPTRAIRSSMPSVRGCAESMRTFRRRSQDIGRIMPDERGPRAVRVLLPTTIQTATLRLEPGSHRQSDPFQRLQDRQPVRQSEAQVFSGREALRNVGQGVLLDAVTAYTSVYANQVWSSAASTSDFCARRWLTAQASEAGDVPTDVARAEPG